MESGNRKINTPQKKTNSSGNKKGKHKKSSVWNVIKVLIIIFFIVGIIGSVYAYQLVTSSLEGLEPLDPTVIQDKLVENSVIVDKEGRTLETIHTSDSLRTVVGYDDISPDMINAIISVEDKTFWDHNGFNIVRMFGAVKDAVVSGKRIGGTSTITQQLARNAFLFEIRADRDLGRKVQEAYYAIQLEKNLTKKQILEGYLNLISFGEAQGIEAAAQTYFSKSAKDLDYIESAMLAGVPKGPSVYSPVTRVFKQYVTDDHFVVDDTDPMYTTVFNEKSIDRYQTAIYLMHRNNYITDEEYEYAKNFDIRQKIKMSTDSQHEISSFFADMVKDEVVADLMAQYGYTYDEAMNMLYTSGLVIESTIDFDMQKILESHYAKQDFTPYYGESTIVAVRKFQKDQGLQVDGSSGQGTLKKLSELSGYDFSAFKQEYYYRGHNSEDVVQIKKALFDLGYMVTNENFPKVQARINQNGDIIAQDSNKVLLYKKANMIDSNDNFIVRKGQYKFDDAGNLVLYKGNYLYFYPHYQNQELTHVQLVLKDMFTVGLNEANHNLSQGTHTIADLYRYQGRELIIPNEYKKFDNDYNVVVDKAFFDANPDFYTQDANGNLLIDQSRYAAIGQGVIQPQSSMVIIDPHNGELKAVVGGRNVSGQRIFNRATNPRQPGSSIKPLTVFTPAIDSGEYTAATVVDDRPTYLLGDGRTRWPINWYEYYSNMVNYRGLVSMRESLEQSINVTAAKVVSDMGVERAADYLQKFGISTLIKEGPSNDMNVAALALGGMTRGITPVELTNAFGVYANKGVLNDYHTYTTVKNRSGKVLLTKNVGQKVVIDENVAYIVHDMMRTGVNVGVAKRAKLSPNNDKIVVSGKTGTTSSNIDAWFVGYTPYYVGGIWFGNDINLPMDQGSQIAAAFWRDVMAEIHTDYPAKGFERPSGIVTATVDSISGKLPTELSRQDPRGTIKSEIFLRGTVPTEEDDVHVMLEICTESGKLAGEFCPATTRKMKLFVQRPEPYIPGENLDSRGNPIRIRDMEYDAPTEECDIHTEDFVDPETDPDGETETPTGPVDPTKSPYYGVEPRYELASGVVVIQRPHPVILVSGETIIIPGNTRLQLDGSLKLPDGSIIQASNIESIPNYSIEELDAMNLKS